MTVGACTALALGVYGAKNGMRVGGNLLERKLGKPPLVRETSRWSMGRSMFAPKVADSSKIMDKIVLHEALAERLKWTANSLINTKKHGVPFRHILLYGPPGTGKTLFARTLSQMSGLDYAIMSGGDVGPLGKDAVTEVNKLFSWAKSSKKGLILFIDEADAFLRVGRGKGDAMSEENRQVLSTFLGHTGTEQENFCIVMATNVKEVLDAAVLDRVDEHFELPLPAKEQRRLMLDIFIADYLVKENKAGMKLNIEPQVLSDEYLDTVAARTVGFSGRQMAKLVLAMQAAVYGAGADTVLTVALADTVVNWKLAHFEEDSEAVQKAQAQLIQQQESTGA
jgi:ATPase family AAA domain-containing protein 3A/B